MSAYRLKTFEDIYTAVLEELKIQGSDTTTLNRVKRIINMVYENEIVPFDSWKWLRGRISLPQEAYFDTGTASVVQHGVTVTLTSAPGPSKKGYYFSIDGQNEIYRIQAHTAGSTSVTLETAYIGSTDDELNFKIWTDAIVLPNDCESTFEVSHDYHQVPLDGKGYQEFKRHVKPYPKAEGYPQIYSTGDYIDPTSFTTISGLPALSTRASSNNVKTLVFATTVAAYLEVGDRIEISGAGHYSYNGEFVISSVSTTTVQYTGSLVYNESATADATLTVKLSNNEGSDERYRELLIYPSLFESRIKLDIDYIKRVKPLEDDDDEPLIPLGDRIVLFYGALMQAWSSIGRNPEESQRNALMFERKLARMAGKIDDSTDLPQLLPSKTYLRNKRNMRRSRDTKNLWGSTGSGGGGSSAADTVTGLANSVATFNNSSELEGSTTITTTELGYLNGVSSNLQTQLDAITTLADGKIYLGNGSNAATEVTPSGDVTITNAGVTAITAGVIVDADISGSAAITHTKLANITAGSVLMGNASNAPTATALSGDVTVNDTGVTAIGSGVIVNADVNGSAAIAYSKLNLATSIVNADVSGSAAIAYSKLNLATSIVNADVSTTAAIVTSKLLRGVVAKTGNYTATTADDVINCSGAAFTITLYAASGNSGRRIVIRKTDSTLANIITIDGDGSETINGSTTTTLNTQYETVELECDGSNWFIVHRDIPSEWTAYTPTGSWTANSTYTGFKRRIGDSMEYQVQIALAGAPTTASLTITQPTGETIDSAKLVNTTSTVMPVWSQGTARDTGTAQHPIIATYESTTTVLVRALPAGSTYLTAATVTELIPMTWANTDQLVLNYRVPISGFKG